MIDDFDEGAFPVDSRFLPWQCFEFNPNSQRTYSCAYDPDTRDGSAYSLRLDFEVTDPMNGRPEYGGAGLVTYAPFGFYGDFSAFATLAFDARVQSHSPALPSNATLNVLLGCSTLADGTASGDLYYVVQDWNYNRDGDWGRGAVSFSNFGPPAGTELNMADCLRRVDKIAFQVQPELLDGQLAAGTLNIDNLYLK